MRNWPLVGILLLSSLPALADSITINVDSGNVQLTPGVDQLLTISRSGLFSTLGFDVSASPGPYTMTMSWTLLVANQAPQVLNFSGTCNDNSCGWISSFTVPTSDKAVPFTLTVQFTTQSKTYTETFNEHYVTTVPEPNSTMLLGTGLLAIAFRKLWAR